MSSEKRSFVARCHCNQVRLSFEVPGGDLPLPAQICHCSICRHALGTLALYQAKIPSALSPNPLELSTVTQWKSSSSSKITRLFCSKCGTHIGEEDDGKWFVNTCVVERGDEKVFEHKHALFVPHSIDGGSSTWLPARIDKWDTFHGIGTPLMDETWKKKDDHGSIVDDKLRAYCQCGGVRFTISRPDWEGEAFRKDYPDLVLPSEDPLQRTFEQDRDNGTWWIMSDRSKYLAGACFCTSCRLSTGSEIHQWAFVPTAFISLPDGSPFDALHPESGTLKSYESSPDTFRRFCRTCGATVFWQHMVDRPFMIDVALGLLDAPEGSRAESWLSWRKREPSYKEDAVNKQLADELTEGYINWARDT